MKPTEYLADFDSATGMLRALSRFLHGKDYPMLGHPSMFRAPLTLVNRLPRKLRDEVYKFGGWIEAIAPERIDEVNAEQIAEWVVGHYPRRQYPAVMIGSSNGAAVHLCAALGIPWLPQTFLVPVRHHGIHPDEPRYALEAFRPPAERLLENNPELQLHHMHDANQDRLMIQRMGYFRIKRRRLGRAYRQFLEEHLEPGGTIIVLDCQLKWPVRRVADRYYFQHGALGGLDPDEYNRGSARVEEYLRRYRSHRVRWDPPEPDAEAPEAEWGFEPALDEELTQYAAHRRLRVYRMEFPHPESLSVLAAALYRWWYRRRNMPCHRLVAESFILMEPWWVLRTGSIPFWMVFNKEPSFEALARYLGDHGPFEEIFLMLFSHGVESAGLVRIERWRELLAQATRRGDFLGVDPERFPRDFATFIRYHTDFRRKIPARYGMPGYLSVGELQSFAGKAGAEPEPFGLSLASHTE